MGQGPIRNHPMPKINLGPLGQIKILKAQISYFDFMEMILGPIGSNPIVQNQTWHNQAH